MKNIKYSIGIFLLLISFMVSAQEDLNRYLRIAAENNSGIKVKFNEYMAALEKVPQAKALPDPQLAFGYFIMPVETRVGPQQFKISASQMFPWFGSLKAKENVSIYSAKAKYEIFKESKSKLFHDVRASYFNVYFNKKAIEITIENINILYTFQKLASIKIESGLVSAVDEYRIKIEIGELENQLAILRDNQFVLEVMFNNLLDIDKNQEITIPNLLWDDDFPITKQAAIDSIYTLNHQLLNLEMQAKTLVYSRKVVSDIGKPSFKIGLDYTLVGKGDNNLAGTDIFMFPNIGITIPLYRTKYKAMVQEVIFLEAARENERKDKTNMLEILFEKAWKEYSDSKRRIALNISQLKLAQKSVSLLETDYTTGNINFEEILRMERMVLKFNLELEKARADKQAAISFINYLMSK